MHAGCLILRLAVVRRSLTLQSDSQRIIFLRARCLGGREKEGLGRRQRQETLEIAGSPSGRRRDPQAVDRRDREIPRACIASRSTEPAQPVRLVRAVINHERVSRSEITPICPQRSMPSCMAVSSDGELRGAAELRPLGLGFAGQAEAALSVEKRWQSSTASARALLRRTLLAALQPRSYRLLQHMALPPCGESSHATARPQVRR